MTDIFKTKWTKEDMAAADDPKMFPAVVQTPHDDPSVRVPSQFAGRKIPKDVVNVIRPRFGHGY
jgi:hypothetical protein